jgi:hypothetical protein
MPSLLAAGTVSICFRSSAVEKCHFATIFISIPQELLLNLSCSSRLIMSFSFEFLWGEKKS